MITAGLVLRFLTNLIMTKVNVSKISCSMSFIDQYKEKKVCLKNKALQKKKNCKTQEAHVLQIITVK